MRSIPKPKLGRPSYRQLVDPDYVEGEVVNFWRGDVVMTGRVDAVCISRASTTAKPKINGYAVTCRRNQKLVVTPESVIGPGEWSDPEVEPMAENVRELLKRERKAWKARRGYPVVES